ERTQLRRAVCLDAAGKGGAVVFGPPAEHGGPVGGAPSGGGVDLPPELAEETHEVAPVGDPQTRDPGGRHGPAHVLLPFETVLPCQGVHRAPPPAVLRAIPSSITARIAARAASGSRPAMASAMARWAATEPA